MAPPADARKSKDGLLYKVLARSRGVMHPSAGDLVTVKTVGWKTDGQPLLRSDGTQGGEPATVRLGSMGPGLVAGIRTMVRGEKRRFWMSEELAAVTRSKDQAPSQVVIDVELLGFKAGPRPPSVPSDFRSPPKGQTSKVLRKGTGTAVPRPDNMVELQYSAWSAEGKLIHDTSQFGRPFRAPVANLAGGLREGVQSMVEGEKRRLWVRAGVIDVELIRILDGAGPAVVTAPPDMLPAPARRDVPQ
jgi:peptidylprolyl isomerase